MDGAVTGENKVIVSILHQWNNESYILNIWQTVKWIEWSNTATTKKSLCMKACAVYVSAD